MKQYPEHKEPQSEEVRPLKKRIPETPNAVRRSLRTRGMSPDSSTSSALQVQPNIDGTPIIKAKVPRSQITPKKSFRERGPISMRDAYTSTNSDRKLKERIMDVSSKSQAEDTDGAKSESSGFGEEKKSRVYGAFDLESMKLEAENVARVVPGRIMAVRFLPCLNVRMVVVGNKFGEVGFWNMDAEKEDGDGIYVYQPHPGPISGILVQPFSLSKMFTACYDGFVRLMDVEKERFDLVYYSDETIYSVSQRPNEEKCLFLGEGRGGLTSWDERAGKSSSSWMLHQDRVNTIDFSSSNANIMATSSTDGSACIWDLRRIVANSEKSLKTVHHLKAVHSAYFSPSANLLATTSLDNKVGLLSGANYDDATMIYHHNQTPRWISAFRGIWGWDDSHIFIGNMKKGVDVISAAERRGVVATLGSANMSAIPCRLGAHPFKAGMLAAATSGGQVYVWTS
ncbi:hypothetical protein RJ639_025622 [Escallonia herrerae]|uniref:WD repeat-containing protein 76 n=1 Tax=Escallonia herrerae TaxID=1293975 RepID=A0AA88UYE4_9ASTE|nr:hypothetical protein RJ639_025622 [Escallonia herrerae]